MRKEWNEITLGAIVSAGGGFIQTGPFGSQLHASDYVVSGIPCIMPTNMHANRVNQSGIAYISELDAKRLSRHLVKDGDIVYSRRGDVTQKALITNQEEGFFCGTGCLLIRPGSKIDSHFLTYQLSTPTSQKWIISNAVGATMPNLNTKILSSIPVSLPSLPIQQRIAAALASLDAKIALNNQINAELEAMAKLLYDYWFVQFDFPDDEGRPYKASGGKMVYSAALGREVPVGWEVKALASFMDCNKWNIKKEDNYNTINYLDTSNLTKNVVDKVLQIQCESEKVPSRAQRVVNQDDILYSTVRPNQCHFGIIKHPVPNMIASTGFAQLTSRVGSISNDLVYLFLTSQSIIERLQRIAESSVSAYPSISPNDILGLKIALPRNADELKDLNSLLHNIHKKISTKIIENQKLAELRDWLLPMLMNGQVKVH